MKYNKPPFTYSDHVTLWLSRGLTIADPAKATSYFRNISYYRLSAYALQFQSEKDKFNKGTEFKDVLNLYRFDKELRMIVFSAIEQIEVSLRSRIVHILAHKYGSHWQDNKAIFSVRQYEDAQGNIKTTDVFSDTQKIIKDHYNSKHPERFIKHYKDTYSSPDNPPCWMIIELLTVGQLSRLYSGLASKDDRKEIAKTFKLYHTIFENWIHALTYGRNLCAHHNRFWNRDFVIQPTIPKKELALPWISTAITNNNRCFYFLSIVKYFLQDINPNNNFKRDILELIKKYPETPIKFMGINVDDDGNMFDWQNEPLWQQ